MNHINNESKRSFLMQAKSSWILTLDLAYVPKPINQLHGRHWSVRWQERKKAMRALSSAMSSIVADLSIPTPSTALQKSVLTAYARLVSLLATQRSTSGLKSARRKSRT